MRLNKVPKGWLKSIETYKKKYKEVYSDTPNHKMILPGRIHPIILFSKYIPLLIHESKLSGESYAKEYVEWSSQNQTCDAECEIPKPKDHLFDSQQAISDFTDFLRSDVQKYYTSNIKTHINAAKFQRLIDEQYGYFLPLVKKYPSLEPYFKTVMKKRALGHFELTRKKPAPLNKTTSVILLFMLYRNGVRRDVIALSGLFLLVGLQPFVLVFLIVIGRLFMDMRKNRVMKGFDKKKAYNTTVENIDKEDVKKPVGVPLDEGCEKEYDAIVLGDTIDALFTAALLSKCGKRVCVLSSKDDAASNLTMGHNCLYSEEMKAKGYDGVPFATSHGQIYNFETKLLSAGVN